MPGQAELGQVVLVTGADGGAGQQLAGGRVALGGQQPEAVGEGGGSGNVVAHDEHGVQFIHRGHFQNEALHLVNHSHVKARKRLIEQDKVLGAQQLLRDGRPLALPAREVGRILAGVGREAEAGEVVGGASLGLGGVVLAVGGQQQVVAQREVVEEGVALLHVAYGAGLHGLLGFAHPHGAGAGRRQPRQQPAQHRLANARAPVDAHHLPLADAGPDNVEHLHVEVAQNNLAAELHRHVLQREQRVFVGVG